MRPVWSVCFYFLLIFFGSALAAPWLYLLIQGLASTAPALGSLAGIPFPRCLSRTLMLLGVVGLWPLTRALGLRSWQDIGLIKSVTGWREISRGFFLGFGSLGCAAFVTLALGIRGLNLGHQGSEVLRHLLNASSAAIIVSIIEESFFRGILYGGLRKTWAWPAALFASSGIYAALHFIQRIKFAGPVDWTSGFVALGLMLGSFGSVEQLFPGFFNLALAGIILGLGYQRTGALYFSMGLHAGWIFWLKSYGFLTRAAGPAPDWMWGSSRLIDGCLALFVLIGLLAFLVTTRAHLGTNGGCRSSCTPHPCPSPRAGESNAGERRGERD